MLRNVGLRKSVEQPVLDLNFAAAGALDSRITFSRGTSATFVGSNGLIQTAGNSAARFDHDPVTNTPRGLLIEEARTNDATQSEIFAAQSGCTIVSNNNLAPDGTTTADTLTLDTSTGPKQVKASPNPTNSNSVSYALSVFAKLINGTPNLVFRGYGNGGSGEYPIFDLANKTVVRNGTAWSNAKVEDYGNGWLRCSAVTTATNTNGPIIQFLASGDETGTTSYTGNGTDAIAFWGAQQEQGSFPTSYIKTTGSSATRNADVATMGPTTGGTELVVNGTFDTNSDWNLPSGGEVTIAGGQLSFTSAGQFKTAQQDDNSKFVVGRRYRGSFDVTSYTSGGVKMQYREGSGATVIAQTDAQTSTGTYTFDFTCSDIADNRVQIMTTGSGTTNTFEIDNVSVRELYPFEAYNPSEGTYYIHSKRSTDVNSRFYILNAIADGVSPADQMYLWHWDGSATTVRWKIEDGGVASSDSTRTTTLDADMRLAAPYKSNDASLALNGSAASTDTSVTVPPIDKIAFGYAEDPSNFFLNGHIKQVSYYARRLSNKTLEALTDD